MKECLFVLASILLASVAADNPVCGDGICHWAEFRTATCLQDCDCQALYDLPADRLGNWIKSLPTPSTIGTGTQSCSVVPCTNCSWYCEYKITYSVGNIVNTSCVNGYNHEVGLKLRDIINQGSCGPNCAVKFPFDTCSSDPAQLGYVFTWDHITDYAYFTCAAGYVDTNSQNSYRFVRCNPTTLTWYPAYGCQVERHQCGLAPIQAGYTIATYTAFIDTAFVSGCAQGYHPTSNFSSALACKTDGTWELAQGCERDKVSCQDTPYQYGYTFSQIEPNVSASYNCDNGFFDLSGLLDGLSMKNITCDQSNFWTWASGCELFPISCPEPPSSVGYAVGAYSQGMRTVGYSCTDSHIRDPTMSIQFKIECDPLRGLWDPLVGCLSKCDLAPSQLGFLFWAQSSVHIGLDNQTWPVDPTHVVTHATASYTCDVANGFLSYRDAAVGEETQAQVVCAYNEGRWETATGCIHEACLNAPQEQQGYDLLAWELGMFSVPYSCNLGYFDTRPSPAKISCNLNTGVWSDASGCIDVPVNCETSPIENGYIFVWNNKALMPPEYVPYICDEHAGYTDNLQALGQVGELGRVVVCDLETHHWSEPVGCQLSLCSEPPVQHGYIFHHDPNSVIAYFDCAPGFARTSADRQIWHDIIGVNDANTVICDADEKFWSQAIGCAPIYCEGPPEQVGYVFWYSEGMQQVVYDCADGYVFEESEHSPDLLTHGNTSHKHDHYPLECETETGTWRVAAGCVPISMVCKNAPKQLGYEFGHSNHSHVHYWCADGYYDPEPWLSLYKTVICDPVSKQWTLARGCELGSPSVSSCAAFSAMGCKVWFDTEPPPPGLVTTGAATGLSVTAMLSGVGLSVFGVYVGRKRSLSKGKKAPELPSKKLKGPEDTEKNSGENSRSSDKNSLADSMLDGGVVVQDNRRNSNSREIQASSLSLRDPMTFLDDDVPMGFLEQENTADLDMIFNLSGLAPEQKLVADSASSGKMGWEDSHSHVAPPDAAPSLSASRQWLSLQNEYSTPSSVESYLPIAYEGVRSTSKCMMHQDNENQTANRSIIGSPPPFIPPAVRNGDIMRVDDSVLPTWPLLDPLGHRNPRHSQTRPLPNSELFFSSSFSSSSSSSSIYTSFSVSPLSSSSAASSPPRSQRPRPPLPSSPPPSSPSSPAVELQRLNSLRSPSASNLDSSVDLGRSPQQHIEQQLVWMQEELLKAKQLAEHATEMAFYYKKVAHQLQHIAQQTGETAPTGHKVKEDQSQQKQAQQSEEERRQQQQQSQASSIAKEQQHPSAPQMQQHLDRQTLQQQCRVEQQPQRAGSAQQALLEQQQRGDSSSIDVTSMSGLVRGNSSHQLVRQPTYPPSVLQYQNRYGYASIPSPERLNDSDSYGYGPPANEQEYDQRPPPPPPAPASWAMGKKAVEAKKQGLLSNAAPAGLTTRNVSQPQPILSLDTVFPFTLPSHCIKEQPVSPDSKMQVTMLGDKAASPALNNAQEKTTAKDDGVKAHFACHLCGKECATKFSRDRHVKTHNKLETRLDFRCEICGNGYTESGNLSRHMRKAHGIKKQRGKSSPCSEPSSGAVSPSSPTSSQGSQPSPPPVVTSSTIPEAPVPFHTSSRSSEYLNQASSIPDSQASSLVPVDGLLNQLGVQRLESSEIIL
eukprot:gb/GEZN01000295.1/.p1 GENE.gb/GEZN01000295.1/~~gb/GEZN01000295.1/.p1  ORF type:complete len:1645 (-),score=222.51 gb/GEZN01000295.1/:145-5079(-)